MKKIYNIILCGLVLAATSSCNKFLDVNNNPNTATASTVDIVLPQALAATASATVGFNSYGAWAGGFQANAGGFGGFGSVLTYNYTTSDNTGLWSSTFDNLNDYQYVIKNTTKDGIDKNFNAIARTMKVFAYQRLVDVYGDVPYSDALRGISSLAPKYDKAEDIYTDLLANIDTAIATFQLVTPNQVGTVSGTNGTIDILFADASAQRTAWQKFAQTIKLRLLVRISAVPSMATVYNARKATLPATPSSYLTTNALVNPGYAPNGGQQNPAWNSYAFDATNAATAISTLPTRYAVAFYNNVKLVDGLRLATTYRSGTTGNQLGYTGADAPVAPSGGPWLSLISDGTGASTATNNTHNGYGILKGPTAGMPIMLASESYFLQAEAFLKGIIPGGNLAAATTAFNAGITSAFDYQLRNASGALYPGEVVADDVADYKADNADSYLVNFGVATTDAQRLEAIITQKWISMNYITSYEGWADFRRTTYPVSVGSAPATSIASTQSVSTRADKLPVRVLYPQSEYAVNINNAPSGIDPFNSRIFWDLN